MDSTIKDNYLVADLTAISPTECSCGTTRRAFVTPENPTATVHLLVVDKEARTHYHKKLTEIYIILEGEGHLELDGVLLPVKPMSTVMIKPGCRHRAVGNLKLINIPIPAFDPADEWFD